MTKISVYKMPAKNLSGKQPERADDGRKFRQIGKFRRFEKQIASRGGKKHGKQK